MPRIRMGDGKIAELPEGLTPEQIQAAAEDYMNNVAAGGTSPGAPPSIVAASTAQALPGQSLASTPEDTSWSRYPRMIGGGILKGIATGIGAAADVDDWVERHTLNPLLGISTPPVGATSKLQSDLGPLVNAADINPGAGPLGRAEVPLRGAAEGLGTGLTALPLTGPGGLVAGALGGAAGEEANSLFPHNSVVGPATGALAGSLYGGMESSISSALANRGLRQASEAADSSLAGAKAKDLANRAAMLAAKTGTEEDLATAKASAKNYLDSQLAQHTSDQLAAEGARQGAVAATADALHPAATLQDAGTVAQSEARNWINNVLPARQAAVWAPVDQAIPATQPVPRTALAAALESIRGNYGTNQPLADAMQSGGMAKLAKVLLPPDQATPVNSQRAPLPLVSQPQSWTEAKKIRSLLGETLGNPALVRDIGEQNLARLYAAQTEDMRTAAAGLPAGPDGTSPLALFDSANAQSKELYQTANGPMGRIVSGKSATEDDPAPEAVAKRLLTAAGNGGSDLQVIRQEIPTAANALAAAHLRTGGDWLGLAPEARAALMPTGDQASLLDQVHQQALAAAAAAKAGKSGAQSTYRNMVDTAQGEAEAVTKPLARQSAVDRLAVAQAAARAGAAKAALPVGPGAGWTLRDVQHGLLGPEIGSALGALGTHFVPGVSDIQGGAGGLLAGALAPYLLRYGRNVVASPSRLGLAGIGGLAGSNALYGPGGVGQGQ